MRAVIRKKMSLPDTVKLRLYQMRDGKSIDLEDGKSKYLHSIISFIDVAFQMMTLKHLRLQVAFHQQPLSE